METMNRKIFVQLRVTQLRRRRQLGDRENRGVSVVRRLLSAAVMREPRGTERAR